MQPLKSCITIHQQRTHLLLMCLENLVLKTEQLLLSVDLHCNRCFCITVCIAYVHLLIS